MPLYEYKCAAGHITDAFRSVDARHECPACESCAGVTEKIISYRGSTIDDIAGYHSVIDGTWIDSRSKHRAHLQRHGVVEVGNDRRPPRKEIQLDSPREAIRRAMEQR